MTAYDFIKNCYPFYFLTVSNGNPCGRPFGAIYYTDEKYYLATGNGSNSFNQVVENPSVQLVALKEGTRNWLRISGMAKISKNLSIKEQMLNACPVLSKHYSSATDEKFAMIEISPTSIDYHGENGVEKLL